MQTLPRHYHLPTPLSVPFPAATYVLICAACYDREPVPHATLATEEQGQELEPTDNCFLCGTPLLEAGVVRRRFEALGFTFVTDNARSAWVRALLVDNAVRVCSVACLNGHAPIDNEDGVVVVKHFRVFPLGVANGFDALPGEHDTYMNVTAALDALSQLKVTL